MAITLQQDINQTLALLNEASSSSIAALSSGTSPSPTIASPDAITYWINQARAHIARTCFPLLGTGYVARAAAATGTTGVLDVLLHTLTTGAGETTGGNVWAARGVTWQAAGGSAIALRHCSRPDFELYNSSWQVTPAGTPAYWMDEGQGNIGVAAYPALAGTLTVAGLVTPPPLVALTDVDTWLPDDLQRLKTQWAAVQIALKNFEDDPPTTAKLAPYKAEWLDIATQLWSRIDPQIRQAHYALPPQGIQAAQGGPDGGGGGSTVSSIGV